MKKTTQKTPKVEPEAPKARTPRELAADAHARVMAQDYPPARTETIIDGDPPLVRVHNEFTKTDNQRIVNALCCMSERLREVRDGDSEVRTALNLTLAADYAELAKRFLPSEVVVKANAAVARATLALAK